jgi:hypothetical protein
MSTLEKAIELAAHYHAGQTDADGAPYILQLLTVMMAVESIEAKTVAVLRDILADSPLIDDDLRVAGFSEAVVQAVQALTRKRDESSITAAHRVASNPLARAVKLAEVEAALQTADAAAGEEYRAVQHILQDAGQN